MGRFCSCFGKLATCFCLFPQEKSDTHAEKPTSGDKSVGPISTTCDNNPIVELRNCRNAPNTIIVRNSPTETVNISESISDSSNSNGVKDLKVEWTSGARKETTMITWKVQDFLALCELKELLRNETCIFTAGQTLNQPTRWCFNLQRMKNEDNIGLFLKRLQPLSFKEKVGISPSGMYSIEAKPEVVHNTDNNTADGPGTLAVVENGKNLSVASNGDEDAEEPVYIHYECMIKRSGHGDVWIHKRTCIPNFSIDQRLGFRKLFTMEDLKTADEQLKPKVPPLLGDDNTLHLEIKFTLHLKSIERTKSEVNLKKIFSLDWKQNHHLELLRNEFRRLLQNGVNADLLLIIESDPDERTFLAHKGVLATRSPVFAAMLQSGMRETCSGIVKIKDVTFNAMQSVLSYMYTGATDDEVNWSDVTEVQDLIYAADKYAVIGLRDFCDKMMFKGCENDNALELLYLAQMHSLIVAVKEISLFIKMNANEIFSGKVY